ncbi:hypothetical protein PSECIP111854_00636 [Pseudoalteromonas sp. CIP111854]|uniref:Uncharacterized protein n=2 Tax=Pseudoalteromonas holothuriae TaxID=2963714 RepID=A0A9W4QS98_9GAMM|nr:hypothetical protein [Pseudoalteromonas sp. CIP111854]CAH9050948.1 hypothetical protein PSECIP111854_00636 [Pseudoalteromonas sp. CIP111854]
MTTIEQANNTAYQQAIDLLKQQAQQLQKHHPKLLRDYYVRISELAKSTKRKRNMYALFQQHFGEHL